MTRFQDETFVTKKKHSKNCSRTIVISLSLVVSNAVPRAPVSTVLRKWVRFFFTINIFLLIIQLSKLKSGKLSGPVNESDQKPGKGKSKKILRGASPGAPIKAPSAPSLGNRSVFSPWI